MAAQIPAQNTVSDSANPLHTSLLGPTPLASLIALSTDAKATPPNVLIFDSEFKELTAKFGETNIHVFFWLTNVHTAEVIINKVRPSCGCTVAKLPEQPWRIASGGHGPIEAILDLRGRMGTLTKTLTVDSSSGSTILRFQVSVRDNRGVVTLTDPDRLRNVQLTLADRQVVFKNRDCVQCHSEPARAKTGRELYDAACAICHDSPQRASMVPDLRALKHPVNAAYWRAWITYGRAGSLMPAFAESQGGPLTDQQIDSLVMYLNGDIPSVSSATAPPQP